MNHETARPYRRIRTAADEDDDYWLCPVTRCIQPLGLAIKQATPSEHTVTSCWRTEMHLTNKM